MNRSTSRASIVTASFVLFIVFSSFASESQFGLHALGGGVMSSAFARTSPKLNRIFAAGRLQTLASRILLTFFFGRPAVVGMSGELCNFNNIETLFASASDELELIKRAENATGKKALCRPIHIRLTETSLIMGIPKIVDPDKVVAYLQDAKNDVGLLNKLAVADLERIAPHRMMVPLVIIDLGQAAQLSSDLARLGPIRERIEHNTFVEFRVDFR
ncbi:hypothetical protein [Methylocella sp. CPCC 101449]|uniref:hypothetical protein n=1 Tax=Methylocella sp. CPCC 101449 TaxID=2987531 RepID=UPI00288CE59D|nr:hypothetical protein [Methylocella sp. CPCC 101449]MDT2021209.1 hypothetical protein [Methylocella sp. CPCC 101449]